MANQRPRKPRAFSHFRIEGRCKTEAQIKHNVPVANAPNTSHSASEPEGDSDATPTDKTIAMMHATPIDSSVRIAGLRQETLGA